MNKDKKRLLIHPSSFILHPSEAYAPLRQPVFRALWTASLVSNRGTWLPNVGAGWLMTGLTPSPLMAALVQAATTLPVFLLALPAGALADVIDRRRLLLVVQGWMLAAAALAAVAAGPSRTGALRWQLIGSVSRPRRTMRCHGQWAERRGNRLRSSMHLPR
jgi:hypothetical protein